MNYDNRKRLVVVPALMAFLALAPVAFAANSDSAVPEAGMKPASLGSLSAKGFLTYTLAFPSNCPNLACSVNASCEKVAFTGTISATGLGNSTINGCVNWDASTETNNGSGGFCENASGTATITAANGSTITLSLGGAGCEVPAASGSPEEFNLGYVITGGTGKFSTASGQGNFSASADESNSKGAVNIVGNFVK